MLYKFHLDPESKGLRFIGKLAFSLSKFKQIGIGERIKIVDELCEDVIYAVRNGEEKEKKGASEIVISSLLFCTK